MLQEEFKVLKVPLARPVTLEFKDAPLRSVFDLMARQLRAYLIEQGRVVQHGESSVLAQDPNVIAHYLGQATESPKAVA